MKKTIFLLFTLLFLFLAPLAKAQETPEEMVKKYDITFPIADLGNCVDFTSCRTYCGDPVNRDTCMEFAKKKGFHKEVESVQENTEVIESAKQEFGCDSNESCREHCQQKANFDKCSNFAKRHNLTGGHTHDPTKGEILEKAKTALGCDSYETCKTFCEKEENRKQCSEFAKQSALRGGEYHAGPGGCTSAETCSKFCSDPNNYEICHSYSSSQGGNFSGPGGCSSEESCKKYCEEHKKECGFREEGVNMTPYPTYDPKEMCNKTPNCSWSNDSCQCEDSHRGDGEEYCKKNPQECQSRTYPTNSEQYPSVAYPTFSSSYDKSRECTSHPGCTWQNDLCSCTGTSDFIYTSPAIDGNYVDKGGFSGSTDRPRSDPEPSFTPQDSTKYPDASGVQGAKTQKSLIQIFIELLGHL